ncbi:putative membrane protein [hydrocarbon metagenome]|uniref:Putative membrane protein n=1 Tax=hydrocarbon metagenome TaxID=938273 RepID=A0A0W8E4Y8_9ZZZZ
METGKFRMFKSLYLKDLREVRTEILVVAAVTIILIGWAYLKTEGAARGIIVAPMSFALGLAGFLPIITSFRLLGREWSNSTIYMMMSLPVSGSMMLGSKLAVLLTEYLACTLIVLLSGGIALLTSFPDLWQQFVSNSSYIQLAVATYIVSITSIFLIFCNSFVSQVTGRLFKKGSGLITALVFLGVFITVGKLMPDTTTLLTRSQLLESIFMQDIIAILTKGAIDLVFAALLFIAAVIIWERRIEL